MQNRISKKKYFHQIHPSVKALQIQDYANKRQVIPTLRIFKTHLRRNKTLLRHNKTLLTRNEVSCLQSKMLCLKDQSNEEIQVSSLQPKMLYLKDQ